MAELGYKEIATIGDYAKNNITFGDIEDAHITFGELRTKAGLEKVMESKKEKPLKGKGLNINQNTLGGLLWQE